MPLALDLTGSSAKVDRAFEHLETLEREMPAEFVDNGPYSVRFSQVDPQTGWCEVFLVPSPQKPRFGIIVGDLMHNLRSALDYIVTALVDETPGVTLARNHQFPIYPTETKYLAAVGIPSAAPFHRGPLKGITHGVGLIEQVQPYKFQPNPRTDALWHVHRFCNADKHREITEQVLVPSGPIDLKWSGTVVENDYIIAFPPSFPKEEAVMHRMRFDPPIARNLRVEGPLRISVVYQTPPFGSEPAHAIQGSVLRLTCERVRGIVESFKLL